MSCAGRRDKIVGYPQAVLTWRATAPRAFETKQPYLAVFTSRLRKSLSFAGSKVRKGRDSSAEAVPMAACGSNWPTLTMSDPGLNGSLDGISY